jgi:hypothetical protein
VTALRWLVVLAAAVWVNLEVRAVLAAQQYLERYGARMLSRHAVIKQFIEES